MPGENSGETATKDIRTVATQSSWGFLGNLFLYFFALIANIFYARILGAEQYGIYVGIISLFTVIAVFVQFAFERSLHIYATKNIFNREYHKLKGNIILAVGICLALYLVFATAVYLLKDIVLVNYLPGAKTSHYFLYGFAFLLLTALVAINDSLITAFKNIKLLSISKVVRKAWILIAFLIFSFFFFEDLDSLFVAHLTSLGIVFLVYFWGMRRSYFKIVTAQSDFSQVNPLLKLSATFLFVTLSSVVLREVDKVMLGYFSGSTPISFYAVSNKISSTVGFFGASLALIFKTMVVEKFEANDMKGLSNLYHITTRWGLVLTMPYLISLLFLPENYLSFFGSEFKASGPTLLTLVFGRLSELIFGLNGIIIVMSGKKRLILAFSIIGLVLNVVLNLVLIPKYGAFGAALATLFSLITVSTLRTIVIKRLYGIVPYARQQAIWLFLLFLFTALLNYLLLRIDISLPYWLPIIGVVIFNYIIVFGIYYRWILMDEEKPLINNFLSKFGIKASLKS